MDDGADAPLEFSPQREDVAPIALSDERFL